MRPTRVPRPSSIRARLLAAAIVLSVAAVSVPLALGAPGAAPDQAGTILLIPDLQAKERPAAAFASPQGQEGFGETELGVQNRADTVNNLTLTLDPKSSTDPATVPLNLGARRARRLALKDESRVQAGFFAGRLSGDQPLGAITRLNWVSGASVAYEAVSGARDLILPLVAREVISHTSIVSIQNPDVGPSRNKVVMTLFNREDGSILNEGVFNAEPGETATWDTANMPITFGEQVLGSNAPAGGYLGHAWFAAEKPVAVLTYGDELGGLGSSAFVARAVADADTEQYLPLVRANYKGETLIAVANASNKAVDVTIEYQGAPFSPSGADQTFMHGFQIAARGAAYVDLSTLKRGSRPTPNIPRGTGADRGFVGSALVRASGPVLAVAQEEQFKGPRVDSVSGYNAFGPKELGTEWAAPIVRKATDYQSSSLVLFNPGEEDVGVTMDLYNVNDQAAGQATAQVPAGGMAWLRVSEVAAFPAGVGSAVLRASGPVAALVYDERDQSQDPEGNVHTITLLDYMDSGLRGSATLTEKGADLEVALALTGSGAGPGTRFGAAIRYGQCGLAFTVIHALDDIQNGKSTTLLKNVSIAKLTAGPHAIVVSRPGAGGLPPMDVMCGFIEEIHLAERVDTSIASAVRLATGGAATPPTPTTPTVASATPTRATGTAPPSPTVRPSDTPRPASPTATNTPRGGDGKLRIYLPYARK